MAHIGTRNRIMVENAVLTPSESERTVVPISPTDVKSWKRVQSVVEALGQPGCDTIQAACQRAGVARRTVYRDFENPYVQQRLVETLQVLDAATVQLIDNGWLRVILEMEAIATSGDSKQAVQAARFLLDVKHDLERAMGSRQDQGKDSAAARAIQAFLGGKRLTLTQTTVKQEIQVEGETLSCGRSGRGVGGAVDRAS
jgi:hypothetical protein